MDLFQKIIELAWLILDKNKECAINIATIDNKLTVSILKGRRRKTYCDSDANIVLSQMRQYAA
jgi:hypothetical protein